MDEKATKKVIGIGAIAAGAYMALKSKNSKEDSFSSGGFGGLGGSEDSSLQGKETGNEGGLPINISFPAVDPISIFRDSNNTSPIKQSENTSISESSEEIQTALTGTKKESLLKSTSSAFSEAYNQATKALTIDPMTLKAGSTKRAIEGRSEKGQPWSLSDNSIKNVSEYVGTPGNVANEQVKKVKEAIGLNNSLSQKGNTFSEYTATEKANSKNETSFFEKVKGVIILPFAETPKTVETASNVLGKVTSPIIENITKAPSSWQGGTKTKTETFDPSNPSGSKETLLTKKEATASKVKVSLQEAAGRDYDEMVRKSSGSSSKSLTTTKKTASSSSSSSGIKRQGGKGTGESKVKIRRK